MKPALGLWAVLLVGGCLEWDGLAPEWVQPLGGPGEDDAKGVRIATDTRGNIYVARTERKIPQQAPDESRISVVKLTSRGTREWETPIFFSQYDEAAGLAADADGNVYLTGRTNTAEWDVFLVKLDGAGKIMWQSFYNTQTEDLATGVAVDGRHVYVTGKSRQSEDYRVFLARFDAASGAQSSAAELGGLGDEAVGVAASGGRVFVLQQRRDPRGCRAFLVDIPLNGPIAALPPVPPPWACATGLALRGSDQLYISGYSWNSSRAITDAGSIDGGAGDAGPNGPGPGQGRQPVLVHYDASAIHRDSGPRWTAEIETTGNDITLATGVAAGPFGDVYLVGTTEGKLGNRHFGKADAFFARYDRQGRRVWLGQYGTEEDDVAAGVATDGAGNVYVAVSSEGRFLGNPNAGQSDVYLLKFRGPR